MSAYLVVNRQYFGEGSIATCYGFQQSGALIGHAVATGLAGAILYVTGSYGTVLVLSIIFSLVGVGVIMTMESGSKVLIPDWDKSLPPEAQTSPFGPTGPIPTGTRDIVSKPVMKLLVHYGQGVSSTH